MHKRSAKKETAKSAPPRAHPSAAAVRHPLTMERVVAAAIELMDRQGVAALSMRKLGSHLSVQAMSLYGYFKNKEDLLLAVRSALFEKIRDADAATRTRWSVCARSAKARRLIAAGVRLFMLATDEPPGGVDCS